MAQNGAPAIVVTEDQKQKASTKPFRLVSDRLVCQFTCIRVDDKAETLASLDDLVDWLTCHVGQVTQEGEDDESGEYTGQTVTDGHKDGVSEEIKAVKLIFSNGWYRVQRSTDLMMLLLKSL